MPAAATKEELAAVTAEEYDKLSRLLESVDPEQALAKDDEDTSIKDTVAHRAHWIGLFLGWYHDGLAGKDVHFPAEGYKWNELKRYNGDLRAQQADLGWSEARAGLAQAHLELTNFIATTNDADLYGGLVCVEFVELDRHRQHIVVDEGANLLQERASAL